LAPAVEGFSQRFSVLVLSCRLEAISDPGDDVFNFKRI